MQAQGRRGDGPQARADEAPRASAEGPGSAAGDEARGAEPGAPEHEGASFDDPMVDAFFAEGRAPEALTTLAEQAERPVEAPRPLVRLPVAVGGVLALGVLALALLAPPPEPEAPPPRAKAVSPADPPPAWALRESCQRAARTLEDEEIARACGAAYAARPAADLATHLARSALALGRKDEARSWAKRAIEADPAYADAYVFLGGAEQELGATAEAKAAFRRYLELAPEGRYAQDVRDILADL